MEFLVVRHRVECRVMVMVAVAVVVVVLGYANSYVSAHSLCRVYISRCERCPVNCVRRSGWDLTDCVSRDAEREDRLIGSMPLFLSLSLSLRIMIETLFPSLF